MEWIGLWAGASGILHDVVWFCPVDETLHITEC